MQCHLAPNESETFQTSNWFSTTRLTKTITTTQDHLSCGFDMSKSFFHQLNFVQRCRSLYTLMGTCACCSSAFQLLMRLSLLLLRTAAWQLQQRWVACSCMSTSHMDQSCRVACPTRSWARSWLGPGPGPVLDQVLEQVQVLDQVLDHRVGTGGCEQGVW